MSYFLIVFGLFCLYFVTANNLAGLVLKGLLVIGGVFGGAAVWLLQNGYFN